jgi:hypothetical protein
LNISDNISGNPLKQFQLTTDVKGKLDDNWGKQLAMSIIATVRGTNSYYWTRNIRYRKNRNIANGKVDMTQFQDRLEMNGKPNYVNINWNSIKIGNTIISRMVGRWMNRNEKIQVTAIDSKSLSGKVSNADIAEFRLLFKPQLEAIQQETGMPIIPQEDFVPEDKDELQEWVSEFNRLPEEIKYEMSVNNILEANGLFDVIKEKMLTDSAVVGFVGTYTYMNEQGEIIVEWVKPENAFYSYSEYDDFRDTTWRGRITTLKISELRRKYGAEFGGKLSEEQIFQIAQTAKEWQLYDKIRWMQEWNVSILRPYDEWNIDIAEFELKSLDRNKTTVTKTKGNNSTIVTKGVPKKIKPNQEVIESDVWNIYRCVYAIDSNTVLEWGLKKNMIRPQDPKELGNAEFSYSFYMYQNYDMKNVAVPEKIEQPIESMILARLKIQQLIAKMKPVGAAINVDAMQELNLGLANLTTPMEAQRIWEQTGNLYYRGRDAEGNPIPVPITELSNSGFIEQLRGLIELYQSEYQILKDELGEDPNLINQAAQPRVTSGNVQASMVLADNSTDYMYNAYLRCIEDTARKIACLLNRSVKFGAEVYREILKEEDVIGRDFSTKVKMLPQDYEIQKLEAMLNNMITNQPQFILYLDPFKIMRVAKEDIKLAELMFRNAQKRFLKTEQKIAQQNSQQNAQIQIQSQQQKAQSDKQLNDDKTQSEERKIILQGAIDLKKAGVQLTPELQTVLDGVIKNMAIPLYLQNQSQEQELQQIQQQQMQAQQQVQQEAQEGQEQQNEQMEQQDNSQAA